MLDTLAINHQGTLIIEAAAWHRRVSTISLCLPSITHPDGVPMQQQGGNRDLRRVWFLDGYDSEALHVTSECPITVSIVQYERISPIGQTWGFESVAWGGAADFNLDGECDIFDFIAFQNSYMDGDAATDFDRSGDLTIFDWLAFLNEFPESEGVGGDE